MYKDSTSTFQSIAYYSDSLILDSNSTIGTTQRSFLFLGDATGRVTLVDLNHNTVSLTSQFHSYFCFFEITFSLKGIFFKKMNLFQMQSLCFVTLTLDVSPCVGQQKQQNELYFFIHTLLLHFFEFLLTTSSLKSHHRFLSLSLVFPVIYNGGV